jgi:hypothetical protein
MGCNCGGKSSASIAYKVVYTAADGTDGESFAADIGGYRMIRTNVEQAGGRIVTAVQVPRAEYDAWLAAQETPAVAS